MEPCIFSSINHANPIALEGWCTPWVNAQESPQHPVLFVTNADKMVLAFQNLVGRFLRYRVHFGLFIALKEFRLI